MTKDEFERQYAERSGVTVEWLHGEGLYATPCDCEEEGCEGWQMVHADDEQVHVSISIMATMRTLNTLTETWMRAMTGGAR